MEKFCWNAVYYGRVDHAVVLVREYWIFWVGWRQATGLGCGGCPGHQRWWRRIVGRAQLRFWWIRALICDKVRLSLQSALDNIEMVCVAYHIEVWQMSVVCSRSQVVVYRKFSNPNLPILYWLRVRSRQMTHSNALMFRSLPWRQRGMNYKPHREWWRGCEWSTMSPFGKCIMGIVRRPLFSRSLGVFGERRCQVRRCLPWVWDGDGTYQFGVWEDATVTKCELRSGEVVDSRCDWRGECFAWWQIDLH